MTAHQLDAEDVIARITLAVASGARTFRDVEDRTGVSLMAVHKYARQARRRGLIDWQDDTAGTLRTDLTIVAYTPPP